MSHFQGNFIMGGGMKVSVGLINVSIGLNLLGIINVSSNVLWRIVVEKIAVCAKAEKLVLLASLCNDKLYLALGSHEANLESKHSD